MFITVSAKINGKRIVIHKNRLVERNTKFAVKEKHIMAALELQHDDDNIELSVSGVSVVSSENGER